TASRSMSGLPATWLRKPISVYSGMATIPERPSRSEASTCRESSPMHETMPMPVTTTRRVLMVSVILLSHCPGVFEQTDPQVGRFVDHLSVDLHLAVGHAKHQPAVDHALD